jgi:hypothetical protein
MKFMMMMMTVMKIIIIIKYIQVKENLEEKKKKYLEVHTLYSEIKAILMEYAMVKRDRGTSNTDNQVGYCFSSSSF